MQRRGAPRQPTQGKNPMEMLSQMMEPGMESQSMPPGMPPPAPSGMESEMPPMSPEEMQGMAPQDADMMSMDDMTSEGEGLPQTAVVVSIEEGMVTFQNDMGETKVLPLDAFPISPVEGMELMQATVIEVTETGISVTVGPEKIQTEIPAEDLKMEFNPGDYFWMPAPPMGVDMMAEGLSPDMPADTPPEMMEL